MADCRNLFLWVWVAAFYGAQCFRIQSSTNLSPFVSSPVATTTECFGKKLIATRHGKAEHNIAESMVDKLLNEENFPRFGYRRGQDQLEDKVVDTYHRVRKNLGFPRSSVADLGSRVAELARNGDQRIEHFVEKLTKYMPQHDYNAIAAVAVKKLGILPDKEFADAKLAPQGVLDAAKKKSMADYFVRQGIAPRAIFVSTLKRARETANIIWGESGISMIGMDMIGEKRTGYPCDTRAPIQESRTPAFLHSKSPKGVNNYTETHDPIISNGLECGLIISDDLARGAMQNPSMVEKNPDVRVRAMKFLRFISGFPGDVAIVSHKGFLREMEGAMGLKKGEFGNAESRGYTLTCKDEQPGFELEYWRGTTKKRNI